MTQDEIIRMFHEAGKSAGWKPGIGNQLVINYLTHFAALVAAHEREACAKLLLDDALALTFQTFGQYRTALAAAIRARSTNLCQNSTKLVSFGE